VVKNWRIRAHLFILGIFMAFTTLKAEILPQKVIKLSKQLISPMVDSYLGGKYPKLWFQIKKFSMRGSWYAITLADEIALRGTKTCSLGDSLLARAVALAILEGWPYESSIYILKNLVKVRDIKAWQGFLDKWKKSLKSRVKEVLGWKEAESKVCEDKHLSELAADELITLMLYGTDVEARLLAAVEAYCDDPVSWRWKVPAGRLINWKEIKFLKTYLADSKVLEKYDEKLSIIAFLDGVTTDIKVKTDLGRLASQFARLLKGDYKGVLKERINKKFYSWSWLIKCFASFQMGDKGEAKRLYHLAGRVLNSIKTLGYWYLYRVLHKKNILYELVRIAEGLKAEEKPYYKLYEAKKELGVLKVGEYVMMKDKFSYKSDLYSEAIWFDEMQQWGKAIKAYEKYLKEDPNKERADFCMFRIAQIYEEKLGFDIEAKRWYERLFNKGHDQFWRLKAAVKLALIDNNEDYMKAAIVKFPAVRGVAYYMLATGERKFLFSLFSLKEMFFHRDQVEAVNNVKDFLKREQVSSVVNAREKIDEAYKLGMYQDVIKMYEDNPASCENIIPVLNACLKTGNYEKIIAFTNTMSSIEIVPFRVKAFARLSKFKEARKELKKFEKWVGSLKDMNRDTASAEVELSKLKEYVDYYEFGEGEIKESVEKKAKRITLEELENGDEFDKELARFIKGEYDKLQSPTLKKVVQYKKRLLEYIKNDCKDTSFETKVKEFLKNFGCSVKGKGVIAVPDIVVYLDAFKEVDPLARKQFVNKGLLAFELLKLKSFEAEHLLNTLSTQEAELVLKKLGWLLSDKEALKLAYRLQFTSVGFSYLKDLVSCSDFKYLKREKLKEVANLRCKLHHLLQDFDKMPSFEKALEIARLYQKLGDSARAVLYYFKAYGDDKGGLKKIEKIAHTAEKNKNKKLARWIYMRLAMKTGDFKYAKKAYEFTDSWLEKKKMLVWMEKSYRGRRVRRFLKRQKKLLKKLFGKKEDFFKIEIPYKSAENIKRRITFLERQLPEKLGFDRAKTLYELALLNEKVGNWNKAYEYLEKLKDDYSDEKFYPQVMDELAKVLEHVEDLEEREQVYKYIIESGRARPDLDKIFALYIKALLDQGKAFEAGMKIEEFEQNFSDSEWLDDVYYWRILAYKKEANWDEFEKAVVDFLNKFSDSNLMDNVYYEYGLYWRYIKGDKDKAREYFEKIVNDFLDSEVRGEAEAELSKL